MSKKQRHYSIRTKLVLIITLFLLISISAVVFVSSYYFRKDNEIQFKNNNLKLAEVIALSIEANLDVIISKSVFIGGNLYRDSGRRGGSSEMQFTEEPNLFYLAVVENRSGSPSILSSLHKDVLEVEDDTLMQYFGEYLERSFADSTEVFNASPFIGQTAAGAAIPMDIAGRAPGSLSLLVLMSMDPFLQSVQSPGITKSFAVNGRGDVLFHYDPALVQTQASFLELPIVENMLKNPMDLVGMPYEDETGKAFLGAFKKINIAGIGVICSVPEEKAFEAVTMIIRRNLLIGFILLNLVIIIVSLYSRSFSRPIQSLVKATMQIEQGDYILTIKPTTRDEIGDLTEAFVRMGQGLAERERMKDAFGKFVNKELAEQVLKGEIKLGGVRTNAAVFFSDIRSFTAISETLEPEEVVDFLNQYMTLMVACVNKTQGVVDKFIGDAIMAIWGTPVSHGNDTENSVNAALMMRRVLFTFNESRGGPKSPVIKIGCGINSGPVLAGQIGSQDRMEYTVIGDTVNLASRIEALNKPFGTDILVTHDAYAQIKGIFRVAPMQKIMVKGKSEPQQIYAILSRADNPQGMSTIAQLRKFLGTKTPDLSKFDPNASEEKKYEIIE